MKLLNIFVVIMVFLNIAGCNEKAIEVISCSAEENLNCPIEKINVNALGANSYSIMGCNKTLTVYCKGPADGCLIKSEEEEKEVFPTRACLNEQSYR
jgi:YbbR domain-containing protein